MKEKFIVTYLCVTANIFVLPKSGGTLIGLVGVSVGGRLLLGRADLLPETIFVAFGSSLC